MVLVGMIALLPILMFALAGKMDVSHRCLEFAPRSTL